MIPNVRAWDKEEKKFTTDVNIASNNYGGHLEVYLMDDQGDSQKERFELMLSTGLKDKNGKGIFEGDILNNLIDGEEFWEELYVVSRSEERACWQIHCIKKATHMNSPIYCTALHLTQSYAECMEVIGNIHENPDLLDQKEGTD